MKKVASLLFLLVLCAFSLSALAQSGSMPPDPDPGTGGQSSGGSMPADPTPVPPATPIEEEPIFESVSSDPVPTPAPKVTKPKPTPKPEPLVQSLGTAEVVVEQEAPPIPEANNSALKIILGVLGVFGLGFLASKIYKNKKIKKEEEKNDPCSGIKAKRDAKKTELVGTIGEVSLQEALVEKLKEKIENKIKDEAKDKVTEKAKDVVLGAIGNNTINNTVKVAQKGKKIYENIAEKYEKAKEILEVLRQKKEGLAGELEQLESACKKCMTEVGTSAVVQFGLKVEILGDNNVQKSNLLFLVKPKENKILLAMKKRGFGTGKWNGVGGKLSEGETMKGAMIREAQEEIEVVLNTDDLVEVAVIRFSFKDKKEWNQIVHVFLTEKWDGVPKETEEMNPKWYDTNSLPYEDMWIDDIHWLPRVLKGEKINASFMFNKDGTEILEMKVEQV